MDDSERERCVFRIISATLQFRHNSKNYRIEAPSREARIDAANVYADIYERALMDGAYGDDDIKTVLVEHGLWGAADEKEEKKLKDDIEHGKVNLYLQFFKPITREGIRKSLKASRLKLNALRDRRHQFDYVSASYIAGMAKLKALVVAGLKDSSGRKVWGGDDYLEVHCPIVEAAVAAWCDARLGEADFRELARTEPWRSIWQSRAACASSVFGVPAADLTDDQRNLIGCSILIDNVKEHPESPAEDVVNDDDALDGWLIQQRKAREREQQKKQAETVSGNEKIANAPEQFIMISEDAVALNSIEHIAAEANRILNLNDPLVRSDLKARHKFIRERGEVDDASLPDVQRELQMQARQMESTKR